jgi:hypothetical protein
LVKTAGAARRTWHVNTAFFTRHNFSIKPNVLHHPFLTMWVTSLPFTHSMLPFSCALTDTPWQMMVPHAIAIETPTFDVLSKIIVPIATFALGVCATLLVKYYEQKRAGFRSQVAEVVELTNAWYNQLHAISVKIEEGASPKVIKALVYEYVGGREVLPKLLLRLEILKNSGKGSSLVGEVEGFLRVVTNYDPDTPQTDGMQCRVLLSHSDGTILVRPRRRAFATKKGT